LNQEGISCYQKEKSSSRIQTAKAGFVICTEQQGLAASPDGYFTCPCHGKGVIEAKCVWSHRFEKLSEVAVANKDFFSPISLVIWVITYP
jgi:hypothetical protein